MWAVIETGGKQYQVKKGDILEVEKIKGEAGENVTFEKVLFLSKDNEGKDVIIGSPYIEGAEITAKILDLGKSKKVTILKHKAKKRYNVKKGHRQHFAKIEILSIENK